MCLFTQAFPARAQFDRLSFSTISLHEGLSQNSVNAVLQDSVGFLWFATEDGLNRYDGEEFRVFRQGEGEAALGNSYILSLAEGRGGDIWVGTRGGLFFYDAARDRFRRVDWETRGDTLQPGHDTIQSVICDSRGRVWIGTEGDGLFLVDPGTFVARRPSASLLEAVPQLTGTVVEDMALTPEGILWMALRSGGVVRLDTRDGNSLRHYRAGTGASGTLPSGRLRSVMVDRDGSVWLGAHGGRVFRLDPATDEVREIALRLPNASRMGELTVTSLHRDHEGRLWIGVLGGGVMVMDTRSGNRVHLSASSSGRMSITSNAVTTIGEDRSGVIWIGTSSGGLNKLQAGLKAFDHYHEDAPSPYTLSGNQVWSVLVDSRGELWVGMGDHGVDRIDLETGERTNYLGSRLTTLGMGGNTVFSMHEDRAGNLWFGTRRGISRYAPRSDRLQAFAATDMDGDLGAGEVRAILEDSRGRFWIGTQGSGLYRFYPGQERFEAFRHDPYKPRSLSNDYVRAIVEDGEGYLWIGTEGGLNRFDPLTGTAEVWRQGEQGLTEDHILCLHMDDQDRLWIGTGGGGLFTFDSESNRFSHLGMEQGLPSNVIYGILRDEKGRLWLSSNGGLTQYDPVTGAMTTFDAADGVQSNEFNAGAYHRSESGRLYFGGINGMTAFQPEQIEINHHEPPVVITGVQLFYKPVRPGGQLADRIKLKRAAHLADRIVLSRRDNVVTFEFAALDFVDPDRNRYAYMLEGFDDGWNRVGTRNTATYTNLPPGRFTLRVQASNNDDVWNEAGASLQVRVVPPFWATWWFRILAAVVLVGSIVALYQARTRGIRNRTRELERINAALNEQILNRKRAEEALRRSEENLRITLNSIGDAVITTDTEARITNLNPVAEELTGWSQEEARGRPLSDVFVVQSHPGGPNHHPVQRVMAEGRIVDLALDARLIDRHGNERRIADSAAPIRNRHSRIIGVVLVFRDVTEEHRLQEQLRQAQKMEAIGRLAGGVAHDFNNMLTAIQGHAQLGKLMLDDTERISQRLDQILRSAKSASNLTRQLLAFSRRQVVQPTVVDLNQVVKGTQDMLMRLIGEDVKLDLDLNEEPLRVRADAGQLEQVVMNLSVNARDAMPEGGIITLRTDRVTFDGGTDTQALNIEPGDYVVLKVADTGMGMSDEVKERIFEPFFTTKGEGRGTGLGLATVFGIVTQSGGAIQVDSAPGAGSMFTIYLPETDQEIEAPAEGDEVMRLKRGRETVLVVEDEEAVREVVVQGLEEYGYTVITADGWKQAEEVVREKGDVIDVALLDVVMPERNGIEVYRMLTQQRPDLRVIFMSGYPDRAGALFEELHKRVPFLQKPFSPLDLHRQLRILMERK